MKVLFLDIDGVLNNRCSFRDWRLKGFYESHCLGSHLIERLNRIIDATNCKVVITSTWRCNRRKFPDLKAFEDLLTFFGCRLEVVGFTPRLPREFRGDEIQAWLDDHYGIESMVILDDDSDMGHLMPYLVKTSMRTGLTSDCVRQAIDLLNKSREVKMLEYVGSCVDVLENPAFHFFATDATQLAQLVEEGQKIKPEVFFALTGETTKSLDKFDQCSSFTFWHVPGKRIAWVYDEDYDRHYFYI